MTNTYEILDKIVEKINTMYKDDVALLCYYGSRVDGTSYKKSDLDMFYVPLTSEGYSLGHQFILDDIGYDLFPISWDRLVKMSRYDEPMVSLLLDSRVYYSKSTEQLERLEALRNSLKLRFTPEYRREMLIKAGEMVNDSFSFLHNIYVSEDICEARYEAAMLLDKVYTCLAYINQTYYHKGLGKNHDEVFQLDQLPNHFKENVMKIIKARKILDIKTHSLMIVNGLQSMIEKEIGKLGNKSVGHYNGFYEELLSTFNKLEYACTTKNYELAYFSVFAIQKEISAFMTYEREGYWPMGHQQYRSFSGHYFDEGFENLLCMLSPDDFQTVLDASSRLKEQVKKYLKSIDIPLTEYRNVNEMFKKR